MSEEKHVPFSRNVPASTGMRIMRVAPITGLIKRLVPSYPDGCNGLVFLRFGVEREGIGQIWPSPTETYLALDDWTPSFGFALNQYVEKGDVIWVDVINMDAVNPHNPVVIIYIGRG